MDIENCKLELLDDSIVSRKITDDEYFSDKYSHYTSNSRLKYINPAEGGSPELFKENKKIEDNPSFQFGTAVHQLLLQSESYELIDYDKKPGGKLGKFIEELANLMINSDYDKEVGDRKKEFFNSLCQLAAINSNYYASKFSPTRQNTAMKNGGEYLLDLKNDKFKTVSGKIPIILPKKMLDDMYFCMDHLRGSDLLRMLTEQDLFNSIIYSNEEALFADFKVTFPDGTFEIVKFKCKIDNYKIQGDTLILNDVKTASKSLDYFMGGKDSEGIWHNGSFQKRHYYRQLADYILVLKSYLKPKYPNIKKFKTNILLIESIPEYRNMIISINKEYLKLGMEEFKNLMIRVGYFQKNDKLANGKANTTIN